MSVCFSLQVCGTEERRDRRAIVNKMESLLKELEGSMKGDGKARISKDIYVHLAFLVSYMLIYSFAF